MAVARDSQLAPARPPLTPVAVTVQFVSAFVPQIVPGTRPLEPPPEVLVVLPFGPGPSSCLKPLNVFPTALPSTKSNFVSGPKLYGPLSFPSVSFEPEIHRIVSLGDGSQTRHVVLPSFVRV